MNLFDQFLKFTEEQGINPDDIYKEQREDFSIVSFGEQGEPDAIYNITLVFYKDNDLVEISVRKLIDTEDMFDILKRVNELNADYMGVSFFVENSLISVKTVCNAKGDIEVVLKTMVQNMQIASTEFVKFKN